ncbi:hypothetical protein WA026_010912 [Henosepilachna vigintioctopunctata]|uniref:Protein quiver n=1 Tax=Henosepilachna vigintioctopunctata TaxID=420089 RepID=A0AAW1UPD2_9CUCU
MDATVNQFLAVSILFCFSVGFTWAVNGCYNCSPEDKGCDDPIKSEMSVYETCSDVRPNETFPHARIFMQQRTRAGSEDVKYICATIQISSSDIRKTGLYRTCLVKNPSEDGCDILKTEFKEQGFGDSVKCTICDEHYCNFLTEETIQNSGKMTFSSVLLYTFISMLFVTCVF